MCATALIKTVHKIRDMSRLGSLLVTTVLLTFNTMNLSAMAVETASYTAKVDWIQECVKSAQQLTSETATKEQWSYLHEKYLALLTNEDISLEQYQTCLKILSTAFKGYGLGESQGSYEDNGVSQYYAQQLRQGVVNKLYAKLREGGYLPEYPTKSKSEALMLGLAQYTAFRWANGQGIENGENLRYSQTSQAGYQSDLTGERYVIRPDCSGLVFTLLKELGCRGLESRNIQGSNTQTLVTLCRNGELAKDPRIKVLEFDPNILQSGDIMVTSVDEPLTVFGTAEPYTTELGTPIRKGHTEVFVDWADQSTNETLVWSWGSTQQVISEFTGEKATPLAKSNAYNYKYIIRFMGGFEAWEARNK